MGCQTCGGQPVQSVSKKTIGAVPQLADNQTLYLDYVAPGIGTYRTNGAETGAAYYFRSSPRSQKGKRVVHTQPPYTPDEINYDDALHLIELSVANYSLFTWRVETVVAPIIERPVTKIMAEVVIDISTLSIKKAKVDLVDLSKDELNKLLIDEKAGKNRVSMISLIEGLI